MFSPEQTASFHGSGDAYGSPLAPGLTGSTGNQSTSAATGADNSTSWAPRLEALDRAELWAYLVRVTKGEEVAKLAIVDNDTDNGSQWARLLTVVSKEDAVELLRDELGIASALIRARLMGDATELMERMDSVRRTAAKQGQKPEPAPPPRYNGSGSQVNGDLGQTNTNEGGAEEMKRLSLVRLSDMPTLPKPTFGQDMISSIQLEHFKVAVGIFLGAHCAPMEKGVNALVGDPSVDLDEIFDMMSSAQLAFDTRCCSKLYQDAPECLQGLMFNEDKRMWRGRVSLLAMIRTIATRVNFRCSERTVLLLTKYLTNRAVQVEQPNQLCKKLAEFVNEFGLYSKIATVDCAVLYKAALTHLTCREAISDARHDGAAGGLNGDCGCCVSR